MADSNIIRFDGQYLNFEQNGVTTYARVHHGSA